VQVFTLIMSKLKRK